MKETAQKRKRSVANQSGTGIPLSESFKKYFVERQVFTTHGYISYCGFFEFLYGFTKKQVVKSSMKRHYRDMGV
jgi:hypothetical protein